MIVEDEELLSNAFRLILEKDGHKVEIAANGAEGLKLAASFKPELILLDLLMPKMGGIEFLENFEPIIKKEKHIVIVLSNLQNQKNVDRALELGATKHLIKSQVTPGELSKLVKDIVH